MLRALFLYLRLLLGFISSTQDGADGLISEPSRGQQRGNRNIVPSAFFLLPSPDPGQG